MVRMNCASGESASRFECKSQPSLGSKQTCPSGEKKCRNAAFTIDCVFFSFHCCGKQARLKSIWPFLDLLRPLQSVQPAVFPAMLQDSDLRLLQSWRDSEAFGSEAVP